ncbi:MAG: hypothetical protein J5616_00905 [Bacteroidaceae bacterium]|nr:hypothetical protein [Bacteroidaceae bacterium]
MIKTGFIKEIGEPRKWNTKEGEQRFTYPVTVGIPYVRQDGKQGEDELVCDHSAGNPEYIEKLNDLMTRGVECDLTISFGVRDYNGKKYNNVKLINISQRIN